MVVKEKTVMEKEEEVEAEKVEEKLVVEEEEELGEERRRKWLSSP